MKMKKCLFFVLTTFLINAQVFHLPSTVYTWGGFSRDISKRISSYPYITGDTFRAFCDHALDEVTTSLDAEAIKPGDTVFLTAEVLRYFFNEIYQHIKHPFIIVTHNRDNSLPGHFVSRLDDDKIIAWFTVNMDKNHPKLHALPIGIANGYWPHGNISILKDVLARKAERKLLLCASFILPTHASRKEVYDYFREAPYCYFAKKMPFPDYLYSLRQSKFVLSPRGNGIDCHRTWEALLMGAVPIVPSSSINSVYADLPVIVVEDWPIITSDMLEHTWATFKTMNFKKEKLYADYWFNLITSYANTVRAA